MAQESILSDLTSHPEQGALRIKDVRYLLIRPETLISFQKALEAEVGFARAGEILYPGGFTGGRLSGHKYKQAFGLSDRESVQFMCRMGSEIGWGRFRMITMDAEAHRLSVEVDNSPFAEAYGQGAQGGVCHFIRGVLGGLGAGVFGVEVFAQETLCLAKGDGKCRFEVKATS
ncbi:MAG: XylR N-terminal domain-containing protein [Anaerolineales bacterium]|jgi:predicted hydrocarbon binding protein